MTEPIEAEIDASWERLADEVTWGADFTVGVGRPLHPLWHGEMPEQVTHG